jgi:hypothetical protein
MQLSLFSTASKRESAPMSQRDAFVHFFQLMDLEMIDMILEKEKYMDLPKAEFIRRLSRAFDLFKGYSDDRLFETYGTCLGKGCENYLSRAIEFVGNRSSYRISFVIVVRRGQIIDISECARFRDPEKFILNRKMIVLSYMND